MPPRTLTHLHEIAAHYSHFLLDMWGVVHNGVAPLPGAIQTLKELKEANKKILFITNSSRPHSDLDVLVGTMGIQEGAHYDYIHSSGDAVVEGLNDPQHTFAQKKYYYLGDTTHGHPLLPLIKATQTDRLEKADYVLFTALTPHTDKVLDQALRLNLPLICANPDIVAIHGDKLGYCPGSAAQKYEHAGGIVIYYGKPYPPIYESALKKMGSPDPKKVLAVGDGLHTDIKGANAMGIDSVFVLGGIHRDEALHTLQRKFEAERTTPTYILPTFVW